MFPFNFFCGWPDTHDNNSHCHIIAISLQVIKKEGCQSEKGSTCDVVGGLAISGTENRTTHIHRNTHGVSCCICVAWFNYCQHAGGRQLSTLRTLIKYITSRQSTTSLGNVFSHRVHQKRPSKPPEQHPPITAAVNNLITRRTETRSCWTLGMSDDTSSPIYCDNVWPITRPNLHARGPWRHCREPPSRSCWSCCLTVRLFSLLKVNYY